MYLTHANHLFQTFSEGHLQKKSKKGEDCTANGEIMQKFIMRLQTHPSQNSLLLGKWSCLAAKRTTPTLVLKLLTVLIVIDVLLWKMITSRRKNTYSKKLFWVKLLRDSIKDFWKTCSFQRTFSITLCSSNCRLDEYNLCLDCIDDWKVVLETNLWSHKNLMSERKSAKCWLWHSR